MNKELEKEDTRSIIIGRLPVMVKSELCWTSESEKRDCDFDHGGYFIVKGAEKVSISFFFFLIIGYFISLILSN